MSDELVQFDSDDEPSNDKPSKAGSWKILVVDDDVSIHKTTSIVLSNEEFDGISLELLHAYSAAQAKIMLDERNDIAVILLDVIMENEHAGLTLVNQIREDSKLQSIRIILRTGQPGNAPEENVFKGYDIHDYLDKNITTAQKLKNSIFSALRAYRDVSKIVFKMDNHVKLFTHLSNLSNHKINIETAIESFIEVITNILNAKLCLMYDSYEKANLIYSDTHIRQTLLTDTINSLKINPSFFDKKTKDPIIIYDVTNHSLVSELKKQDIHILKIVTFPLVCNTKKTIYYEFFIDKNDGEFEQYTSIVNAAIRQLSSVIDGLHYEEQLKEQVTAMEDFLNKLAYLNKYNAQLLGGDPVFDKAHEKDSNCNIVILEDGYKRFLERINSLTIELSEMQQRLTNIIDIIPVTIISLDNDKKINSFNKMAEHTSSIKSTQAIGNSIKTVAPLFYKNYKLKIDESINHGKIFHEENINNIMSPENDRTYNLEIYPYHINNTIGGAVIIISDVTEKNKISRLLQHNERVILLGDFAKGVAQELVQPLSKIKNNVKNISTRFDDSIMQNIQSSKAADLDFFKMKEYLNKNKIIDNISDMSQAVERSILVINNLLSFTEKSTDSFSKCNLKTIVDFAIELLSYDPVITKNIRDIVYLDLSVNIKDNTPLLVCNKIELEQALFCILKYRLYAIFDAGKKENINITIEGYEISDMICIKITDNGFAIKEKHLKDLFSVAGLHLVNFDVGLGLSTVKDIIEVNHRGTIEAKNYNDQGMQFIIHIPIISS